MKNLSNQQLKCLYFLSRGMSYKEIARELKISPRTVEYYLAIAKAKTGSGKRSELVKHFLGLPNENESMQFGCSI